jgi:hypothetical protein
MHKNKKNICLYLTSAITMIAAVLFIEPAFAGPVMQTRPAVPDLSHPLRPALPDLAVPLQPNKPHTRPLPIKQVFRMEQGVLLIEDQVANTQYITTLDSRGSMELGSPAAAIFGARIPRQGAKKPAVWYTHKTDPQVKQIHLLKPREAFQGMADEYGNAVALSGDRFEVQNGRQLNPVLSPAAFDGLAKMSAGASRQLSLTEILADGRERERINTVYKRGQLTLGAAPAQSCRNEVLDGVAGKLCVLRTIQGQHQATTGGDIKFTIRSRIATPNARFRVGANWHRLGESVPLAEFANSKQIEVFFVPPAPVEGAVAMPLLNLDRVVEAGFYSSSRLSRGDRFNLQISNRPITDGTHSVMSRLGLLLIDDQPSGRQYITTLSGTASQAVFGERRAQGGTRPVIWYAENSRFKSLFPLLSIVNLQPPQYFAGVANEQGQISVGRMGALPGYVNPAFNEQAFADFVGMPVGKQQLLSFDGQRSGGDKSRFQLNLSKAAQLILSADGTCRAEAVEGVAGQVCVLRRVGGESKANTAGEVRFRVSAHLSAAEQAQSRYRVSHVWHKLGEPVGLAEFGQSKAIELFIPDTEAGDNKATFNTINGEFYAPGRSGDRFVIGMRKKSLVKVNGGYMSASAGSFGNINFPLGVNEEKDIGTINVSIQVSDLSCNYQVGFRENLRLNGGTVSNGWTVLSGGVIALQYIVNGYRIQNSRGPSNSTSPDTGYFGNQSGTSGCDGHRRNQTTSVVGTALRRGTNFNTNASVTVRVKKLKEGTASNLPIPLDTFCSGSAVNNVYNACQQMFAGGTITITPKEPELPIVVTGITATPNPVTEGSTTKVTVTLNKVAPAGQKVYVKFATVTADINDLRDKSIQNLIGATGSVDLGNGGVVAVKEGVTKFTFDINTLEDADEVTQSFEIRATEGVVDVPTAPKIKVDIQPIAGSAVVTNVSASPSSVLEGSTTVVTVTLNKPATEGQMVHLKFIGVTATIPDLSSSSISGLQGATGSVDIGVGGAVKVNAGVTKFSFVLVTKDDTDNFNEEFDLRAKEGMEDVAGAPTVAIEIKAKSQSTSAEVISVTATPATITEGGSTKVTVKLNRAASANQKVYVKLQPYTADSADLSSKGMLDLRGASGAVNDLEGGGAVLVNEYATEFSFIVATANDADILDQYFSIRAKEGTVDVADAQKAFIFIKAIAAEPAVVTGLTATPDHVIEGNKTTVTVKLNKGAPSGQKVFVKFIIGSANISDLSNHGMSNISGATGAVTDLETGGVVTVDEGASEFTFDLLTAEDSDESEQFFLIGAKEGTAAPADAPRVVIYIKPKVEGPAVVTGLTATPNPVIEGNKTTVTVKLNKGAPSGQKVFVKFISGSANISDLSNHGMSNISGATDAVTDLETGGVVTVNAGASEFTFDLLTAEDSDESDQFFGIRAKEGTEAPTGSQRVVININPQVEALKVESVVANPKTVLAGGKVSFTVTLNKPIARSRANQAVFVQFAGVGGSPAWITDLVTPSMLNLQGASGAVSDLSVGAAVAVPIGGKTFTFDVETKADAELFDEQFEIRANIGTTEDLWIQAKDSVTIKPAPLSPPSIEFSSVATEQAGVFKVGAPAVDMSYGVRIRNVAIIRKHKDIPASKVAAYLKQRTQRAFAASIKLDSMGTANVGGAQYCTFTSDRGSKLIPLPVSMIYNAAETPFDCNGANGISLGYPGVTGDWSAQDATTYIARVGMKFTMGDPVSQKTSTGGYWYGIARSKGKLVLSLNTGP